MIEVDIISIHDLSTHQTSSKILEEPIITSNEEINSLKRFIAKKEGCNEDNVYLRIKILK